MPPALYYTLSGDRNRQRDGHRTRPRGAGKRQAHAEGVAPSCEGGDRSLTPAIILSIVAQYHGGRATTQCVCIGFAMLCSSILSNFITLIGLRKHLFALKGLRERHYKDMTV